MPAGVQQLIRELFAGQTVERSEIVKAVERAHLERGGVAGRVSVSRSVMRALNGMKHAGVVENPQHGFWRIAGDAPTPDPQSTELVSDEPDETDSPAQAEVIIGSGDSSVYLYYFPAYRRIAEAKGDAIWRCKIGRSDRDPIDRVLSQASTALPERPIIGVLLRTSLPGAWEKAIHNILALRGRIVDDAPGDEWFNTSIDEVVELIRYIDPNLPRPSTVRPNN